MTDTEFFEKLQECYQSLTPSEKLVADFLSHNLQVAAFLTCVELGQAAGVSDSTVIRLANVLGFGGFAQMKKTLQGMVLKKLSAKDRLTTTMASVNGASYAKEVYDLDKFNLEQTFKLNSQASIDQAVEMLDKARKIFVVGLGISAAPARFFCSRLSRIGRDVVEVTSGGLTWVEKMAIAEPEDVMLAFSFPAYSKEKIRPFKYIKQQVGGRTLLITDRRLGDLQAYADLVLVAGSDSLAYMNSIIGAALLSNIISVGLAFKGKSKALDQLARNQELAEFIGTASKE